MTVEHFRVWSKRFKLKNGARFVLEDWQALFLEDLFARTLDNRPLYYELWLLVPEANGKTTFTTLVSLYVIEFVPEAWVPVAASARDQGVDLTYRTAAGFIQRNGLDGIYRCHPGYRQIVHQDSLGALKIFAADAGSGDGVDPHLALLEELHRARSMELYETWSGKLEKSQGQLVVVSTAGEPGGPFEEKRKKIRLGASELRQDGCFTRAAGEGIVMHDYALPEDGDPEDLELVASANPFSGITVESLARKKARSTNMAHWKRFTCNLPTHDVERAISEREWFAARTDDEIPEGVDIAVGLDLGFRSDTTAAVPLWIRDPEYRLFGPATVLVPPNDRQLDQRDIESALLRIHERNPIRLVVMDPYHGDLLAHWIEHDLGAEVVERRQTIPLMALDYSRFMEALREGWLLHAGDEAFTRHALNAVARVLPRGDILFERPGRSHPGQDNSRKVVDALDAAAMVHSTMAAQLEQTGEPWFAYA